jgi:elongation factor G
MERIKLAKQSINANDLEAIKLMQLDIEVSMPVYFCSVEPESEAEEKQLIYALQCLQREDPSLRVLLNQEENLGLTIIQGMGALQLEIVKDRILKEYNLKVRFGPLNIAYKEKPTTSVMKEPFHLEKQTIEKKHSVYIELSLKPRENYKFKSITLIKKGEKDFDEMSFEYIDSVNHGVKNALNRGKKLKKKREE